MDRLTSAATSAVGVGQYSHTYQYNAIGNLTSYNGNGYTYGSQPHAVTAAFGNSYSYDAVGNQTSRVIAGTPYTQNFDYDNRLLGVAGGSVSATFLYDAESNRVKGTVAGVTTVYISGLYEYQNGAVTKYYGGGALRRMGYATDNGVFYVVADHLRSTSVLVNQDGTVKDRNYYYPYGGNRGGSTFSGITTKRFTGQYHEPGLPGGEGLSYYNARWYDSQIAVFISADTLVPSPGNPQTFNRYAYVDRNPLRYLDPTGHYECQNADCNAIRFTPGGYVYFNPNYSPLFHLISIIQRGHDSARRRMNAVLNDTYELNATGKTQIDRFIGFTVGGNFRHLGGEKGDRGFRAELGDEHWYHEVWGSNTREAQSRQVGHLLSAITMGLRRSPGALIIGHEQTGDQHLIQQIEKAAATYYNTGVFAFQIAAIYATNTNITDTDMAKMDELLEPLLGQVPFTPTADRPGNSLEDLRLSTLGYVLGTQILFGILSSNRDLANWLVFNVSEGY